VTQPARYLIAIYFYFFNIGRTFFAIDGRAKQIEFVIPAHLPASRRGREASFFIWIPAFAGITANAILLISFVLTREVKH